MDEFIVIYNSKQNKGIWQDEAQNEIYVLKPGEYKVVKREYANYFIGLDEEAKKRVLFRRIQMPIIQTCKIEELADLIANGILDDNNNSSKEASCVSANEAETISPQGNNKAIIPIRRIGRGSLNK